MAFTVSKVFTTYITDIMNNTTAMDVNTDALLEVALFSDTVVPDQTVTSANSAYGAGVWAANHITDTGTGAPAGWPTLGRPLSGVTSTFGTTLYTFAASDTVSGTATTTLAATTGCLVYDHSAGIVTDQGFCFNYFGGPASVTLGTFTVHWGSGVITIQC
ncbi:MAG: hypothetical protein ACHQNA_11870 [Acidimicrobiales bacterium]